MSKFNIGDFVFVRYSLYESYGIVVKIQKPSISNIDVYSVQLVHISEDLQFVKDNLLVGVTEENLKDGILCLTNEINVKEQELNKLKTLKNINIQSVINTTQNEVKNYV